MSASQTSTTVDPPAIMSFEQLCNYLQLSDTTIRIRMKKQNDSNPVPYKRTGVTKGKLLFSRRLIDEWFERECLDGRTGPQSRVLPTR